jgi:competence protein ComEC
LIRTKKYTGFIWTRTRVIQIVATAFMVGLLLTSLGTAATTELFAISVLILIVSIKRHKLAVMALMLSAFNLGLWRGQVVLQTFQPLSDLYEQRITVVGQITDDPVFTDRNQSEFHINNLRILENDSVIETGGRLRIRGFIGGTKLNRGDIVEVNGQLGEGFGNRQGQISFAQVKVLGQNTSLLEQTRRKFIAATSTVLPGPQGSLGLGFLVGTRSLLPEELEDQLALTGLTHIVAVSGYNLTIIIRLTRRFLARFSRYLATASSIGLIIGFLAVTGISPSVARASVVVGLALAAWYYGRPVKPMVLLLLSGAITAGINPTYIWLDLGWYLSFLAFFGVLVLAPLISARLYTGKRPSAAKQVLIETTSAQIMTLPLIALIFGELSIISLLANMIILPLIPLTMLLTFIAGIAGMISINLGLWLAMPGAILLNFMVRVISMLAGVPWAAYELRINRIQITAIYISILVLAAALRQRLQSKLIFNRSVVE